MNQLKPWHPIKSFDKKVIKKSKGKSWNFNLRCLLSYWLVETQPDHTYYLRVLLGFQWHLQEHLIKTRLFVWFYQKTASKRWKRLKRIRLLPQMHFVKGENIHPVMSMIQESGDQNWYWKADSEKIKEDIPFQQYRRYQLQSELCEILLFSYVCFQSLGRSYVQVFWDRVNQQVLMKIRSLRCELTNHQMCRLRRSSLMMFCQQRESQAQQLCGGGLEVQDGPLS